MTKNRVFIIQYDPTATNHELFEGFWEAVDTGKKHIQPKNLMVVDSIETAYKVMTEPRMEIFYAITEKKPTNISQLACLLNKDYSNVWKDCQVLANIGIIKLKKENKEAKSVQIKPIPCYERIIFDFPSKEAFVQRLSSVSLL